MTEMVDQIREFFVRNPRLVLLTGAGASAESGIPTYRDASGKWLRSDPIQHQEFLSNPNQRRRYWGRSMVGWPGVRDARPNKVHLAITRLEAAGRTELIITQNVDRLHQRAGSQRVIDLHGRLDRVKCLECHADYDREHIQHLLEQRNPHHGGFIANARPDGDADLDENEVKSIHVVDCQTCNGLLMPDVVFFGGSVPRARVQECEQAIQNADALLVVGSSLQVYSGYRFCKQAHQLGKPIAIFNEGITRADPLATLKVEQGAMAKLIEAIDQLDQDSIQPLAQPQTAQH